MSELAFEAVGSGERVALLHGANQSARSWRRVAAALRPDFEVLSVDLPFHGKSADIAAHSVEEAGELVGDTVGAATYVGYFVGGRAAIELALSRPQLVRRLVLLGSVAGAPDEETRARRRSEDEVVIAALENPDEAAAKAYFEEAIDVRLARDDFFFDAEGEALERAANLENTPKTQAQMLRYLGMSAPGRRERFGELAMPVLVVAGELAPPFVNLAREVTTLVGDNARLEVLPGAGHPAPFERPTEFAALVSRFIAETPLAD